jgi:hypothetical protein
MRVCSPELAEHPTEELEEDYNEPADVGIGTAAESDDMKSQAKAVVDVVLSTTDKLISSIIDDQSRLVSSSVSLLIHFQCSCSQITSRLDFGPKFDNSLSRHLKLHIVY